MYPGKKTIEGGQGRIIHKVTIVLLQRRDPRDNGYIGIRERLLQTVVHIEKSGELPC